MIKAVTLRATKESFRTVTEEYLTTSLSITIDPITINGTANMETTVRIFEANSKGALTKYWAIRGCKICKDVSISCSKQAGDKKLLTVNVNEVPR